MFNNQAVQEYSDQFYNFIEKDSYRPVFITTQYTENLSLRSDHNIDRVFKQYDAFYRHFTSNLMNNFTRKRCLHPRTLDFIDYPNSRNKIYENASTCLTPHIHSIYLFHPATIDRYNVLKSDEFKSILNHRSMPHLIDIYDIDIQPTRADLERVISYSSKFVRAHSAKSFDSDTELFNQYPKSKDELKIRSHPDERFYEPLDLTPILSAKTANNNPYAARTKAYPSF